MTHITDAITIEGAASVGTNLTVSGILDIDGFRTANAVTTTAAATQSLTSSSSHNQIYTGSTASQIVKLPDATTLSDGHRFQFWNEATVPVAIQDGNAGAQLTLNPGITANFVLRTNGTAAGVWDWTVSNNQNTNGNLSTETSATTTTTTTSLTDVLISGMTITPTSGVYFIQMSGVITFAANNQVVTVTIYSGGTSKADSVRSLRAPNGNASTATIATNGIVTVNGSQAIEIRWNTSTATGSIAQRTLDIIKVG